MDINEHLATCIWTYDDDIDFGGWNTSCGAAFILIEGSPSENDYHYCPMCGGKILIQEVSHE